MTLEFEKIERKVALMDPFRDFQETTQTIEYRRDPLLERWSRINIDRTKRTKTFDTTPRDQELLSRAEASREKCYFCTENLEKSTPRFPRDLTEEGRIKVGGAVVFPNLFPFGENHAVCVISPEHLLTPKEIGAEMWHHAIEASIRFFEAAHNRDPDHRYPSVNLNLMPPSGASILHPHFQIMMESRPSTMLATVLSRSRRYRQRAGRSFWKDLVEQEKDLGRRHVFGMSPWEWVCPWSPIGNNEVMGIHEGSTTCVTDLSEGDIKGLASSLEQVMFGLQQTRGASSLNMALFSAGVGENVSDNFSLHLRIISRPTLARYYVGDRGFMEVFQDETVIHSLPEVLAHDLKTSSSQHKPDS